MSKSNDLVAKRKKKQHTRNYNQTQTTPQLSTTGLSQVYSIGQGFDVFGAYEIGFQKRPIFDPNKANTIQWTINNVTYDIPEYITGTSNPKTWINANSGTTEEEFNSSFAAEAKIKGKYKLFKGQVEALFSKSNKELQNSFFYSQNFFSELGIAELNTIDTQYFSDNFLNDLKNLPSLISSTNIKQFYAFFDTWGGYFIKEIKLGGSMRFYSAISKSTNITDSEFQTAVKASFEGLIKSGSISGSVKTTSYWKMFTAQSEIASVVMGGDFSLGGTLQIDATDDFADPGASDVSAFSAWQKSIATDPAIIEFALEGIWALWCQIQCGTASLGSIL